MTLWRDDSHDQTEMFWMGSDPALRHSLEIQDGYSQEAPGIPYYGEAKVKTKKRKKKHSKE